MPMNTQKGFLLTRQVQDRRNGLEINLWLKTRSGAVKLLINNELALFFVETKDAELAIDVLKSRKVTYQKVSDLALKTFNQFPVSAFYFSQLSDFYNAKKCLTEQQIKCYEDDIRPDDRYLMERFITSSLAFMGEPSTDGRFQCFSQAKCKPVSLNAEPGTPSNITLDVISLDIECAMDGQLYSIGIYNDVVEKVFMIGRENDAKEPESEQYIQWVNDEKDLLNQFICWLNENDPDVIIGWNVINFDFDLLQQRCDVNNIAFTIGRDGRAPYWRRHKNNDQKYISIAGRVVLDGIDLLKTATYSFPSFALENVAQRLLGVGKKVDNVDDRLAEITDNFLHNKPALAAYNLEDCRLVWLIFEKTHLLSFAMLRSTLTGLELDRVGGSVAAFTNLYLPKLHRAGYVAPNMGDGESDLISPGGFVMDSTPGLYQNVLVLDFKSLYPSIIKTFKIDPLGLIEGVKSPENAIEGFDGAYFSRDKHFLPEIIEQLWQERDQAKRDKDTALSQAIKIIMNSFYGVLGSTGCRFFDPRLSGAITKRSHELLKTTKQWIEDKGYQVIYGDTDSIFVHVGNDKSPNECSELGKSLQRFINERWQENIKQRFKVESHLEIEFETHFLKFFMPTIRGLDIGTKKRYAGIVETKDGQKLIFKGLESVRTDWTKLAKDFQQALYLKVFNDEPVEQYIRDIVADTLSGKLDKKLVYRKRIRRKLADYVKNVPPHVKAARLADAENARLGKPLCYQRRGWIEYVITIHGPQAVEYQHSPIDYPFYIERQLSAIADAILPFIQTSFTEIVDNQLNLFS